MDRFGPLHRLEPSGGQRGDSKGRGLDESAVARLARPVPRRAIGVMSAVAPARMSEIGEFCQLAALGDCTLRRSARAYARPTLASLRRPAT